MGVRTPKAGTGPNAQWKRWFAPKKPNTRKLNFCPFQKYGQEWVPLEYRDKDPVKDLPWVQEMARRKKRLWRMIEIRPESWNIESAEWVWEEYKKEQLLSRKNQTQQTIKNEKTLKNLTSRLEKLQVNRVSAPSDQKIISEIKKTEDKLLVLVGEELFRQQFSNRGRRPLA